MEKIFNDFSVVGAFIGGILSFIFGKPDDATFWISPVSSTVNSTSLAIR